MQHFNNGVNLGGWLSQFNRYDHGHFRSFITEPDVQQIASWGMDHVRLPVDYPVLESDEAPGSYREDGFQYIDACITWCKKYDLGLIIDLHRAPGYSFTNTLKDETRRLNTLFTEEAQQQRFIQLWQAIARRYQNAGIPLILELLNEIVLPESAPWNALAHKTVTALREVTQLPIMIGGNNYNSAGELANLALHNDPLVYYTFHFYEPLLFTHQKAHWTSVAAEYDQTLDYPGAFTGLTAFLEKAPHWKSEHGWYAHRPLNRDLLMEFMRPALDFAATGRALYCGEFGVIDAAPVESRRNWLKDLIDILRQHQIGRSVWSYKQMNFGLVDANGQVVDPEVVQIVSQA